ncbi:AMP-dependent synthetase/ligase [Penicillium paradoxum]|uniref:AMP-dependent synthetase/ligase n=1 Tax=Penicillium paradoxum TaxID=176176 RepID=UPI002546719E|nr:AMP-dependent synthetase/ligase [Penicillium paradoxum]KAJ5780658.1 AMP-dependent synthetase/ligase [Penicillium paradoxum]
MDATTMNETARLDAPDTPDAPPSAQELEEIWANNAIVPESITGCVHDLIAEITQEQPDALAVCAWDGNFTYSQLSTLSNHVARSLCERGIPPKSPVALLFPKSKWTCVAELGIIKAGCAAVALDATHPNARLQSIIQLAQPQALVCAVTTRDRASILGDAPVLQLDDRLLKITTTEKDQIFELPVVSPTDIVYISFTSGTTGQPKGACISHANVRSAVHHQGKALGFNKDSRVFDFAPYSFDVAWSNALHTLCAGACLCISNEQDMVNNLSATITAFGATLINVTPTVLRTISPVPPSLETVLLSGEMPYRENVTQWAERVRLLNTYGPTECTWKCTFSQLNRCGEDRPDIGKGIGFCLWIVNPNNSSQLVSPGTPGELYLEGPMVGQGYLSNPEKTEEAFINDPEWLLSGSAVIPGRHGRLYKTGDLVKTRPDGSIVFLGRKDVSQLKVRGQRIEIGDVEHHARACLNDALTIIADIVLPQGSETALLGLFVQTKDENSAQVKIAMNNLVHDLEDVLPGFMIPGIYIPVNEIPVAGTGKVDRRKLREIGDSHSLDQLLQLQSNILPVREFCGPSTPMEKQLCELWAQVLSIPSSRISATDSFLRLGGDSVAAMLLAAAARKGRLSVTVADVFKTPVLSDLALVMKVDDSSFEAEETAPFSLMNGVSDLQKLREEAAKICHIEISEIEDIYPSTALQQGMLSITARSEHRSDDLATNNVSRTLFELPDHTDLAQFEKAWTNTLQQASILRTRVVDLATAGLMQVVVNSPSTLNRYTSIDEFIQDSVTMGLGVSLCRVGLITGDSLCLIMEMHHSIFDGWSTKLILDAVEAEYHDKPAALPLLPFREFVKYTTEINKENASLYWKQYLDGGSETKTFPFPAHQPGRKLDFNHNISGMPWARTGTTPSSVVRAALALLLASYTNSNDIRYGATISGRQATVPGIERIAGPTIATIPVRAKFDWNETVQSLLEQLQRQAVEATEHEQLGLQEIAGLVDETNLFQLLLVVQPAQPERSNDPDALFNRARSVVSSSDELGSLQVVGKDGESDTVGMHNPYPMMMICQLHESGVELKINFDSGAMKTEQVQRMSIQFEHLLRQLCSEESSLMKVSDISAVTKEDLADIWNWNVVQPELAFEAVTDIIDRQIVMKPRSVMISAWDQQFTAEQVHGWSISLADRLFGAGVTDGSIVVLAFEKSAWQAVVMLAALKVGAIVLPMSVPVSKTRAMQVVESLQPHLAITSTSCESSPFDELIPVLSVADLIKPDRNLSEDVIKSTPYRHLPGDPALLLFTSGSTGTPKAIAWNHSTLSSNIHAATVAFGLHNDSRVFQFAGYDFDVSTVEALATLSVGGCLCIPSETDRRNRLMEAINGHDANWMCLTPSVAETLCPNDLPSLQTVVFAGEKLERKTAHRWLDSRKTVHNWYGPAEASVATSCIVDRTSWHPGMIGKGRAGLAWLVDPKNPNLLAPVGAVAELCMEGSMLARYTGANASALNKQSFASPLWLQAGHWKTPGRPGPVYRTGDLVTYDSGGNIIYLGRSQDSQRKIRGQRIDLGEIERCIQGFLMGFLDAMLVAEILSPSGSESETLVLFVSPTAAADREDPQTYIQSSWPVDALENHLAGILPSYMIPRVYIPLSELPIGPTGKTDRRRLREIGSSLTVERLAEMQPARKQVRKVTTDSEKQLQQIWGHVLGVDADIINATDHFLRLGGDSISAMRLVGIARNQGFSLTVADVFETPELETMVERMVKVESNKDIQNIPAFSLLPTGVDEAYCRSYAARICSVSEDQILDVYPCTALQEGLLALGARRQGQYVSRSVLPLQNEIDPHRLKQAWRRTVDKMAIMRTRIVDLPGKGLVQVVLKDTLWRSGEDIEQYLLQDEKEPMALGSQLCRAAIIDRTFIFTIHHCLYDGSSLPMILEELEAQYSNNPGRAITGVEHFIRHLTQISTQKADDFWKAQLTRAEFRPFPALPSPAYKPEASGFVEHTMTVSWPSKGATPSTILRAAWAILSSQYVASTDVIFGVTVSGRQANVAGMENCVGPTIATVPVAVSINWEHTVETFLQDLQRQGLDIMSYEQYGLPNIQRAYGDPNGGLFQTLLVVQPMNYGKGLNEDSLLFKARSFAANLSTMGIDPFNVYALMVICQLTSSGVNIQMSFDPTITDKRQIKDMVSQLETVIHQLCTKSPDRMKLETIQTASGLDLERFWTQNAELPPHPTMLVHDKITLCAISEPDRLAVDAWDGQWTYGELDQISTAVAHKLILHLGVTKGSVVPLCFVKSRFMPIAQLAVWKAGGMTLLQSADMPEQRMSRTFQHLEVQVALASPQRVETVSKYARCMTMEEILDIPAVEISTPLPVLQMEDSAAVLTSSGSTGEPKHVLWSHRALAANAEEPAVRLSVTSQSRMFQFSSYDFDNATLETIMALTHRACLCIPSEAQRLDSIASAINHFSATWTIITPSTARILRPQDVPGLLTVVMGGENVLQGDVDRWKGHCGIRNWYGPAEFPPVTIYPANEPSWFSSVIGRIDTCRCWLVDPHNRQRLVPYGAIGEIVAQGPALASRYVRNPTLTDKHFYHNPRFLSQGHEPDHPGREGYVYRTGDLARYDADGFLVFIGRKDAQMKVRGQLVVPKEVETHIQQYLDQPGEQTEVIVDTITPPGGDGVILVGFIVTQEDIDTLTNGLNQKLQKVLPRYAVPSWYIGIPSVPLTVNRKRDRKRLHEIAAACNPSSQGFTGRAPTTTAEITLARLWSLTLGSEIETISATDSFLQVGNSIDAMRLVGTARQHGLLLTVAKVMESPILEEMARLLQNLEDAPDDSIEPFALLDPRGDPQLSRHNAASACGVNTADVEDLFPCTSLQTGLLALTAKSHGDYTGQNVQELDSSTDVDRFKHAWEELAHIVPILRTRIVDIPGEGFVQVVIKEPVTWSSASSVEEYLNRDRELPMGLGTPLMRCGLFSSKTHRETASAPGAVQWYFALTMHHSIYDGPTSAMIIDTLKSLYNGESPLRLCPFQSFVKYICDRDEKAASEYWKAQFAGCEASQFPLLSSSSYQPRTDSTETVVIDHIKWRNDGFTPSTAIRAAFSLVCGQYAMSSDIVFGTVVMGRKAPIQGTERIAGPTIATVPVRVHLKNDATILQFLQSIQDQERDMIPHEQTGLSNIRQVSSEAEEASRFQTLLVIQPPEQAMNDTGLFVPQSVEREEAARYHSFSSYALSVVCNMEPSRLKVEFCYDSAIVQPDTIHTMKAHLEQALRAVCTQTLSHITLGNVNMMPESHLNDIWSWNAKVPNTIDRCMHDLIKEVAEQQPDATAISAWDGSLTYAELDRLSTGVANQLVRMGVKSNMIVPLCFEKSMYAMLAILGVVKAGGATLLLDPSLPDSRLDDIVQQVKPTVILSSISQQQRCCRWVNDPVVFGKGSAFFEVCAVDGTTDSPALPSVSPNDLLFTVFTSGSTGTPKGCLIQHQQFTSAVVHQRSMFEMDPTTRIYDFSSYSFDAVYWSMFHVWFSGGTLCIPSEEERKNDLTESVRRFGTTHVFLTPSTARWIDPKRTPTLRYLFLGGEAVLPEDLSRWPSHVNVFDAYGPAECSACALCYQIPKNTVDPIHSNGKGVGLVTWVVDPADQDKLAPLGTVGELYLEGPLVGQGYFQNEEKTAAAFIEDPSWLSQGSPDGTVSGRRGRMYKTGDLVRYDPLTGNLSYVGRKDTQVKLRGQRIELADVQHHVNQCLIEHSSPGTTPSTIAEVINPTSTGRPMLAVFIECEPRQLAAILSYLEAELPNRVPSYMVPATYVATSPMPITANGKTDRRKLREIGSSLTLEQLARNDVPATTIAPSTPSQCHLQALWVEVLGVPAEMIGVGSSFVRLGGDSISAMRLASLARAQGLGLSVQNILTRPQLSEMAESMSTLISTDVSGMERVDTFSLFKYPTQRDATLGDFASQCDIQVNQIEDIFPCTGVQKSLLSMTAKRANSYVARLLIRLRDDIDEARFINAWETVSRKSAPILRTRIVDSRTEGLVQGVVDEPLPWDPTQPLQQYLAKYQTRPMGLATPLTRLAIVENESDNERYCLLTQHHAIYDGYSLNLLVDEVSKAYDGVVDDHLPVASFQAFIKHVMEVDSEEAKSFWSRELADFEAIPFPSLPHEDHQPKADSTVRRNLEAFSWPQRDVTPSTSMFPPCHFGNPDNSFTPNFANMFTITVIRASWAILSARYMDSDDVVFGAMVTGRQAPLLGLDRMIAPLINAVPIRVKLDFQESVDSLLAKIQQQSIDMISYEQTELLAIRRIDTNTDRGSRFNTLLVVQPATQAQSDNQRDGPYAHPRELISATHDLDDSNPNAIMIICQLTDNNGLQLEFSFDSRVVDIKQMERVAAQFEHVLRQVCTATTQTVEGIQTLSNSDLVELWEWNASVPQAISTCVHDLITTTAQKYADQPAICAWNGNLTYAELDELSTRLAWHLLSCGVGPGVVVPICFEKSMWHPVSALGVMKSGAACLSIDSTQPESRLQSIVKQVNPRVVLTSTKNAALVSRLSDATPMIVDQDHIDLVAEGTPLQSLPTVEPSNVLYVVFTSGSTGTPKGVVTTHQNFASAATHQADMLRIQPSTRVFDFVSYSFDVSWSNTLQTLIRGGCLCIPDEMERRNDIAGAFNRMDCNYSYFTPSVVRSLDPSSIPGLKTLAMGGEPIPNTEIARWTQAEAIIGIYGPAECAQALTFTLLRPDGPQNHVGYSYGARTWLVQPGCPDRLAPIGAVGELLIEGPTVSRGYFNDSEKTAAAYIHNPTWLLQGAPNLPGRQAILYKTGDLLRYNSDGTLDFLGRKDGMVKLRGQRIELAEVEYHVRANLRRHNLCDSLAAEIITPSNSSPILAVFFALPSCDGERSEEDTISELSSLIEGLDDRLSNCVPQYMIPGSYIPIKKIPMTTTDKTDRRTLREFGSKQTLENLAKLQSYGTKHRAPTTTIERKLQNLWSTVLGMDANSINADSNFLRIGGESIAAMRLVAAARNEKLSLTVADIFSAPRLSQLALLVQESTVEESLPVYTPFALLEDDPAVFLARYVDPILDPGAGTVVDVLPCTDFQICAILDAFQDPPSRLPHWIFDLPANVDFMRLEQSCRKLVNHYEILRTVFVKTHDRFWQVLLKDLNPPYDNFQASQDDDITAFTDSICELDRKRIRTFGSSFIRFMAVRSPSSQHRLIFRISHAQFDGFSWDSVLRTLFSIYSGDTLPVQLDFAQYATYRADKKTDAFTYWTSRLKDTPNPAWGRKDYSNQDFSTSDRLTVRATIPMPKAQLAEGLLPASLFHAACAMVLSRQYQQAHVAFGRLVTGRSMLPSSLQNTVGPTMTEVPISVQIDPHATLSGIASQLQHQFIEDSRYESAGMEEIIRNCTDWPEEARDFGWRTSFQQEDDRSFTFLGAKSRISFYESDLQPRNRPEIYATPRGEELDLEFEGNRQLITEEEVQRFIQGLETVLVNA